MCAHYSDYYCQTDDPEPKHPGEAGKKTILGIDSDVDGVRDDVEVWINNYLSNTPKADYKKSRDVLKKISKYLQDSQKYKDNETLAMKARMQALNLVNCTLLNKSIYKREDQFRRLNVTFYNTIDRLHAWAKTEASLNGLSFAGVKANCGI